jgi:hypothetical protein
MTLSPQLYPRPRHDEPSPLARAARIARALGTVLLAAGAAFAAPPPAETPETPESPGTPDTRRPPAVDRQAETEAAAAVGVPALLPSGLLVFVDPATGRILERPRPEQLAALRALRIEQAARAGSAEERQRVLDSLPRFEVPGGFGVDVDGLFESSLVVERAADGSLRVRCAEADHHGHDHVTPAPGTPDPAAPPEH